MSGYRGGKWSGYARSVKRLIGISQGPRKKGGIKMIELRKTRLSYYECDSGISVHTDRVLFSGEIYEWVNNGELWIKRKGIDVCDINSYDVEFSLDDNEKCCECGNPIGEGGYFCMDEHDEVCDNCVEMV
jgi:hypothetical protein